ncbi:NSFL1 cofactor p47 isoform X2 [Octopus sinensis]|uniref:NSFL1 cofactor p47 isoform X2 n=1 Tax=Octopus sinensis TaxID=2607531 RepID=A0A6P7SF74_9MOLL|nr:NSFL1 cofactor p47 isoform X2 [Octopus sinensis]
MDPGQESLVEQFIKVTEVDRDRAKFFLESSSWDLELAMESFYKDDQEPDMYDMFPSAPIPEATKPPSGPSFDPTPVTQEGNPRGQQVLGPPKKFMDLFKQVKKDDDSGPEEDFESKSSAFCGTGYRLGDMESTTPVVIKSAASNESPEMARVLNMWKNGFNVDNGPLREYTDERNREFLESITRREIPQELSREAKGGKINLNINDYHTKDYVPPKETVAAFSGKGHMLGSPLPGMVSTTNTSPATSASSAPVSNIEVNKSLPTTNLQIRLSDGSRMTLKLNHTHQISDIRTHILLQHPEYEGRSFFLATYPSKELQNESLTLAEGNLLNAVIIQRMR